jgi:3-oxoacyl-[acyl-carrier-protein] synthase II
MYNNRVVVTGLGAVTPIGTGIEEFWKALLAGRNGIGKITQFDTTGFRSILAAEVKDFNAEDWLDKKSVGRMDRFTHFALAASIMAMKDSGLASFDFESNRAGVIVGSGIGGMQTINEGFHTLIHKGPKALHPFFVSKLLINMAACMISIKYGLKGPLSAPSVACSSGSNAIGDAFRIIQRGDADIMFAGGTEACISPLAYGGFCATRSMTPNTNPANASRPFDKNRDGFVMGEGAGILILENLQHALKRKAKIYAEITGYASTADAFHFTAPHPESDGMIRVMQAALDDAGMKPEQVQYINAHGTSTVLNDKCESAAISKVFRAVVKTLKVSSIKSMIGHLLAAAGAVEFVSTIKSIYTGKLPPTINYETPDPDCPLDYVKNKPETIEINAAMSNSFGFGGGNACLIAIKYGG